MSRSATPAASDDDLPLPASAWRTPEIALWLAVVYLVLIIVGALALRLPGASTRGNEFSIERCVFTSINAATLTGFQQSVLIDHYGPLGRPIVLGLMVAGTLLTLIIGGLALTAALRLPFTPGRIIGTTIYVYLMALGIGTTLLLEQSRGLLPSATQAASAFGNAGLFLGRLPAIDEWRTHVVLMPLAMIGGLGVPVILELSEAIFGRRKLSMHSSTVLALLAGVYIVGAIALTPWEHLLGGSFKAGDVAVGSAMSLNSRSCGLPLMSLAELSRGATWVIMLLMLIGAAPAGAAGGMKVTALFHLLRGTRRAWRGEPGLPITAVAATWIVLYILLVFGVFLALLATLPQMAAERLAFLATSAVSNVGLAHEPVALAGPGLWVLSAAMLIGRALPLMLLWWVARNVNEVDVAV